MFISTARIEELIAEDVPYIDLTSEALEIGKQRGEMRFFTREDCVCAGTMVASRVGKRLGCETVEMRSCGERVSAGETLLVMQGPASGLHSAWKVSLNLLDHMSGIATKTRRMVDAVHVVNASCEVLTTRKSQPGAKDLLTAAVMAGGAYPHRLGLSETVLVFENHWEFLGGFEAFVERLPEIRSRCVEKKLFVEASPNQACELARAGVDGIQLDKVDVAELGVLVEELRSIDPHVTLIAAGGVNEENCAAFAACGVDGLATTAPFNAKPIDMSARMRAL